MKQWELNVKSFMTILLFVSSGMLPAQMPSRAASQLQLVWGKDRLVSTGGLGTRMNLQVFGHPKPVQIRNPTGTLSLSASDQDVWATRFIQGNYYLSRKRLDDSWESFPIEVGEGGFRGAPCNLYPSGRPDLFFGMQAEFGFRFGEQASCCSWWRLRQDGVVVPQAIITLEMDKPIYRPVDVMGSPSFAVITQDHRGLLPICDFPIQVPGAFVIVSWQAGVLWVVPDGQTSARHRIELLPWAGSGLAQGPKARPGLLGIQPMKNGNLLVACRTDQPAGNAKPEEEPANIHILWKVVDPESGHVADADDQLLAGAPRHLSSESEIERFAFSFDEQGRLVVKTPTADHP